MSKTEKKLKDGDGSGASTCSIFKRLSDILKDQFIHDGIIEGDIVITLDTNPQSDLGADSLDIIELIMAIEVEFSLDIPDRDVVDFTTVGDFVDYLRGATEKRIK